MKLNVKCYLFFILFIIPSLLLYSQNPVDTNVLVKQLGSATNDSVKMAILAKLSRSNKNQPDVAIAYSNRILKYDPKSNKSDYGYSYIQLATIYKAKGKHKLAEDNALRAMDFAKKNNLKILEAKAYGTLGNIYAQSGEQKKSILYLEKCLSAFTECGDTSGILKSSLNIGGFYYNEKMYEKANICFRKMIPLAILRKDNYVLVNAYNNLGNVLLNSNEFDSAQHYYFIALRMAKEFNYHELENATSGNLGDLCRLQGKYDESLSYYTAQYNSSKKEGYYVGSVNSITGMIEIYKKQGKDDLAQAKIEEYRDLASKSEGFADLVDAYVLSSELYKKKKRYKEALESYERFYELKDSLGSADIKKQVFELHEQYQSERKDNEILQKTTELEKEQMASRQRSAERNALLIIVVFAVALIGFVYRSYHQKKRYSNEITEKKNEAEHQRELVEEKNKEILDSIIYAKRIQTAILPPMSFIQQYLPNSFVLYQPKDIVAGDFYWMHVSKELTFIAAADCTGHGVPGALVSLVCSNALNRTVNEFAITETGKILDKVRELVMETFEKSENEVKDGMDISICSINSKTKEVMWSGANNPLWYLSKGTLLEIKADKQPIGKGYLEKPFATHNLKLSDGDMLYLFTDGYPDQFGGPNGKKFKYKKLQELILSIYSKPTGEQKISLDDAFKNWRGAMDQVDDVCIIGIRV